MRDNVCNPSNDNTVNGSTLNGNTLNDNLININTAKSPETIDISHIHNFLGAPTPDEWIEVALQNIPILLQDHANCEKKAAGTAMNLVFRYEFHQELQLKLAQLIREEMLHYEQVIGIMEERSQAWTHLPAGRYAKGLLKYKRTYEPAAMIDVLIIGAFIEARSCERFAALSEVINDERLAKYYRYLLKSESRHFEDYIALAKSVAAPYIDQDKKAVAVDSANASLNNTPFKKIINASVSNSKEALDVDARIEFFKQKEADLITSPDTEFRFHSGIPAL